MLPETPRVTSSRVFGIVAGALAAGALLAALLPAHAARADDGISIAPADGNGQVDQTRSRLSYDLAPGQQLTDQVLVSNAGSSTLDVTMLATDAFNSDEGAFTLLDTTATPKDAGSWVTFGDVAQLPVHLAAGEQKLIPFTVKVPADAAPGDHAGGVVVSTVDPSGQILIDRRVATRMYLRVAGDLQPLLSMGGLDATYRSQLNPFDGSMDVTMTVANTGNVALAGTLVTTPTTWFGIPISAPTRQQVSELLPGAQRMFKYTVPGVPQLGLVGVAARLQPTASTDAALSVPPREVSRDASTFVMPWWLVILLGLAAATVIFVRIRRRRDARLAAEWIAHTEEEARRRAAEVRDEVGAGTAP